MKTLLGVAAIAFSLGLGGCLSERTPSEPATTAGSREQSVIEIEDRRYIPVGTAVPVGDSIVAPPEPFDPRRHILQPSPILHLNLVGKPGVHLPPRRPKPDSGATSNLVFSQPAPGTGDFGLTFATETQAWEGIYSLHDIGHDIVLPSSGSWKYLYAPTMLAPNYSCIETTTVHQKPPGGSTEHYQGWYSFCFYPDTAWQVYLPTIIPAFTDPYVRTYLGKPTVTLAVYKYTYLCWRAIIFNYSVGLWDEVLISCATPAWNVRSGGWSVWESYYLIGQGSCPGIENLRALDMLLWNPQSQAWNPVSDLPNDVVTSASHPCVALGPYDFIFPGTSEGLPANSWLAKTPPYVPYPVSLTGPSSVRPGATCLWTATPGGGYPPHTYSWFINNGSVANGSSNPNELIYQNTGSGFMITVQTFDFFGFPSTTQDKSVTVSASAPTCQY